MYINVNKLQYNMFLKKYQSHTYILFQIIWTRAYFHPAFLSLRCTYKDWTIKSFPWKQVKLSRYGQNVWKIIGKEIEYLWMKANLNVLKQKSHIIIFHILCDMGLPCTKLSWERSGSVVECLSWDRGVAGLSLTSVTALWSLSKTHLS